MRKILLIILLLCGSVSASTEVRDSVTATNDDVHFDPNDAFDLTDYVGYLGNLGDGQKCGFRFDDTRLPQGSTIDSAFIYLRSTDHNTADDDCLVKINAEDTTGATAFSDSADYVNRIRTTAYVEWGPIEHWTTTNWYPSPDIKTVIQEVVNRADWDSTIVLFLDDNGSDASADRAAGMAASSPDVSITAKLVIFYSEAAEEGAKKWFIRLQ